MTAPILIHARPLVFEPYRFVDLTESCDYQALAAILQHQSVDARNGSRFDSPVHVIYPISSFSAPLHGEVVALKVVPAVFARVLASRNVRCGRLRVSVRPVHKVWIDSTWWERVGSGRWPTTVRYARGWNMGHCASQQMTEWEENWQRRQFDPTPVAVVTAELPFPPQRKRQFGIGESVVWHQLQTSVTQMVRSFCLARVTNVNVPGWSTLSTPNP